MQCQVSLLQHLGCDGQGAPSPITPSITFQVVVCVLGAAGYLGQFVMARLLGDATVTVVACVHSDSAALSATWRCPVIALSLTSSVADITAALSTHRPDVVVNCAALAALPRCEADPAVAMAVNCPTNLIAALQALGKGAQTNGYNDAAVVAFGEGWGAARCGRVVTFGSSEC